MSSKTSNSVPARPVTASKERRLIPVPAPVDAAPRVRRTQAERSRVTRERLMQATVELMRLRGYGGLTTTEVSDRAGVSRGAQLHHFPTKNDLVLETMRYLNERMLEASAERAARARARGGDPLDDVVEDAFDFFFGDYFFITLAITMSDERNEALREGVRPLTGPSRIRIERRWVDVMVASGWPRPLAVDMLALTLSMVRGFAVRRLIQDDRKRFDELMRTWKSMVTEHVRQTVRMHAESGPKPRRKRADG